MQVYRENSIPLNGTSGNPPLMSGTDIEDGVYTGNAGTIRGAQGVIITSLPANGVLRYNGVALTQTNVTNQTLYANPALFSIELTGSGYTSVQFGYAYRDASGATDATPATYTVSWPGALPVDFGTINAMWQNGQLLVKWTTLSETNNSYFEVEASVDGENFTKIGG